MADMNAPNAELRCCKIWEKFSSALVNKMVIDAKQEFWSKYRPKRNLIYVLKQLKFINI